MAERGESALFINRELSWLEFNRRVMDLSREKHVPLGEQLHFAAIYGSNLDEFFMIRVGSLYDQSLLKNDSKENKTQMTPQQQIDVIMPKVAELQKQCDKNVQKLYTRLAKYGLHKVDFAREEKEHLAFWKRVFLREVFPVLSPQIVDRRHPFPFLRNQEIYIGAMIKEKKNQAPVLGLIPVSAQFERLIVVADEEGHSFALVEELILQFAELAFGKSNVVSKCIFRVTRNADLDVEEGMFDHDIDYRVVMGELLKKRRKLAAVRLQFYQRAPAEVRDYLLEKLMMPQAQCIVQNAPLDLDFLHHLSSRLHILQDASMFYPPVRAILPAEEFDLYTAVQQRDMLFCFPYQSMRPFIRMLHRAARDPDVLSIKMTLYRVASESKVIEALISAAENGKEVVTIVELRARFDEQNNIDWSRRLEQAGCTVIYGFTDYKVHSKLTLITRKNGARFEYICQIGTGNYNEKTSELYTDLSYLTTNQEVGEEIAAVFNNLAVERHTQEVNHLIVAPEKFKSVLAEEIREEMRWHAGGGDARVIVKCNSISDKKVIETLSEASGAGVPVDMIVRGICCLQAGLPGLSENIRVISIVGRYLEHSRVFAFGVGERLRIYIASGDFLTRNTERRVEVGVRIGDEQIKELLYDILELQLADNVNARQMQPDGSYAWMPRQRGEEKIDCQMAMYPLLKDRLTHIAAAPAAAAPPVPPKEEQALVLPPRRQGGLRRRLKMLFARPVAPGAAVPGPEGESKE
ncbi:polyphosphate kinase 1 [Ruminococcaceae bacterium OttesenSCG-928-O06]|nr:polyphosphate kinase 1 [Ruminococcaceae bacterium OttesenSCG-928-O06]